MKFLLDTHILLWALSEDDKLPEKAKRIIEDNSNEIYYSVLSLWEIEIKHMKHPDKMFLNAKKLDAFCKEADYNSLSLNSECIFKLNELKRSPDAPIHLDPFDRMLISQAISNNIILLTHDERIKEYTNSEIMYI